MTTVDMVQTLDDAIAIIKKQKAEIERLQAENKKLNKLSKLQKPTETSGFIVENNRIVFYTNMLNGYRCEYVTLNEIARELNGLLQAAYKNDEVLSHYKGKLQTAKFEAIKEFAEKIDQLFYRYAHLHSHADMARKDYIKADDGTEIEMQSVWDVFTLKKYGIAEYQEMNRLQTNIELIEKGKLLAELQKDFKLLVKELTQPTKIEHNSLCETETYKE